MRVFTPSKITSRRSAKCSKNIKNGYYSWENSEKEIDFAYKWIKNLYN